jgi:hypothetical protein
MGEEITIDNRFIFEEESPEIDPVEFIISDELLRRHMDADQKRDVVARLLKDYPSKSNRYFAALLKMSHHTVQSVRTEMEGRGQIAHVETRTDTRGRSQPARRPARADKLAPAYATPPRPAAIAGNPAVEPKKTQENQTCAAGNPAPAPAPAPEPAEPDRPINAATREHRLNAIARDIARLLEDTAPDMRRAVLGMIQKILDRHETRLRCAG